MLLAVSDYKCVIISYFFLKNGAYYFIQIISFGDGRKSECNAKLHLKE